MTYTYADEFISGWTDENVAEHFRFDSLGDLRHRYVPISPFSITREVRRGVAGFRVYDMRSGKSTASLRVKSKATATRIA